MRRVRDGRYCPTIGPNNAFNEITGFGVRNRGRAIVDARDNWWGDASGPYHETENPGGIGVEVSGNVDFWPFLTHPPGRDAVTIVEELGAGGFRAARTMLLPR